MDKVSYLTQILLDSIEYPSTTVDEIASRYAWTFQRAPTIEDEVNWKLVNEAIIERWSKTTLLKIKKKVHSA